MEAYRKLCKWEDNIKMEKGVDVMNWIKLDED